MKIYAGYYHFDVNDPVYDPVYRIADHYGLPVAIHSGDTFSEVGLLEYSHPLRIDRLAVTWRDVQFIICHMGWPWLHDACEVAFKNRNVAMDISGMLCGNDAELAELGSHRLWQDRVEQPLVLLGEYHKVLFGTDWPLAPLAAYIELCQKLIPQKHWQDVFHDNAARIFKLKTH
jgi:hypothetical protein